MILQPPRSTRTDTLFPYTTLFRSRVWDGGTARQLKLVDRFGDLNDAIAEAARRAKLDPAKVHPVFLEKKPSWIATLAAQFARKQRNDDADAAGDVFSRIARDRRAVVAPALGDMRGSGEHTAELQ